MFGLHAPELLLILVVALLLFGADKLPEIAKSMGKAVNEFRKSMQGLKTDADKKIEDRK